eukprot:5335777-Prymnesium_polylepis.1
MQAPSDAHDMAWAMYKDPRSVRLAQALDGASRSMQGHEAADVFAHAANELQRSAESEHVGMRLGWDLIPSRNVFESSLAALEVQLMPWERAPPTPPQGGPRYLARSQPPPSRRELDA